MDSDQNIHLMDRDQAERALAVLREEREANPITPFQRRSYFWLRIVFWGFWLSLVGFVTIATAVGYSGDTAYAWIVALVSLAGVGAICLVGLLITIVANLSLFRQAWRQMSLARAARIWKTPRRHHPGAGVRTARVVGIIAAALPGLMVVGFLVTMLAAAGLFGILAGGIVLLSLVLYLLIHITHKRLGLLSNAKLLEERLLRAGSDDSKEASAQLEISSDDFESLAEFEDMQIERRRSDAVQMLRGTEQQDFSLLKSKAFASALDALDVDTQLLVEGYAEDLASQSVARGARGPELKGAKEFQVPETTLSIECSIDPAAQRIELLSLRGGQPSSADSEIGSA